MKFVNSMFEGKAYYISNGWSGRGNTIKQYQDGVPGSTLDLSYSDLKQFIERLKNNGWTEVDEDPAPRDNRVKLLPARRGNKSRRRSNKKSYA
jgi:hypothetical protein